MKKNIITLEELLQSKYYKQGDYFSIALDTSKVVQVGKSMTGVSGYQYFRNMEIPILTCRSIAQTFGKELILIGEPSNTKLYLYGKNGAHNGMNIMDTICKELYGNYDERVYGENVTIEDYKNMPTEMQSGEYWVKHYKHTEAEQEMYCVRNGKLYKYSIMTAKKKAGFPVRPKLYVQFNTKIWVSYCDGKTKNTSWRILYEKQIEELTQKWGI